MQILVPFPGWMQICTTRAISCHYHAKRCRGELPADSNLHGELTIRKGSMLDNPRGGKRHTLEFKLDEGYDVLKAKIMRLITGNTGNTDTEIYFKRSKSAVQSQCVKLTDDAFEANVRCRWSKISQGDVQRWQECGETAAQAMRFEFFVHMPRER